MDKVHNFIQLLHESVFNTIAIDENIPNDC